MTLTQPPDQKKPRPRAGTPSRPPKAGVSGSFSAGEGRLSKKTKPQLSPRGFLISLSLPRPKENEEWGVNLLKSNADTDSRAAIDIAFQELARAGVPRGRLVARVLVAASTYDHLRENDLDRQDEVKVRRKNLLRLVTRIETWAKTLEDASKQTFAALQLPHDKPKVTQWRDVMLGTPLLLREYAASLRFLLTKVWRQLPSRPRKKGLDYSEADLFLWVQELTGKGFNDKLYDHVAELLQQAGGFWHPGNTYAAKHYSPEAIRKRLREAKGRMSDTKGERPAKPSRRPRK